MATQSNQGTSSKHEVKLAIYDLSQGMAGALSAQFLGPNHAIDIIPHTGIIAYGYEYYFGQSGIEKADPSHFRSSRGLHPIDIHHLGETHVTQHEFEEWCRQHMTNGHYAPTSYDLFHRNCNNFSHHAATEALKLPKAVPEEILVVPHKVLSSPMGEFIRPMMQQMQISPSGDSSTNSLIGNHYNQHSQQQAKKHSHPDPTSDVNPWANLPSEKSEEKKEEPSPKKRVKHVHTPTLDNYNSPMIANEKNMIDLCVNKLVESKSIASLENTLQCRLLSNLKQLLQIFQQNTSSNENTNVIKTLLQDLMHILSISNITSSDKIYMLMITRLLVLDPTMTIEIISNVMNQVCPIVLEPTNKSTLRAIAWCVLSNILGSDLVTKNYENFESMQEFVDAAVTCLSNDTPVETRRGAAAFLYNLACLIAMKDDEEIADLTVSIICASAEAVPDEVDVDVVKRLFATIGKIVKTKGEINEKATSLIVDLGYGDRLTPQNLRLNGNDEVKSLAREMSNILTVISSGDC